MIGRQGSPRGEARWPMALAILAAGALRYTLPDSLRVNDAPWLLGFLVVVMLAALIIGDPGAIDRQSTWLRVLTDVLIASITIANAASAVRLVSDIIGTSPFTNDANTLLASGGAIWLTNVIAFGLWYWDLDRGGAAARAHGEGQPTFVFPEMTNSQTWKLVGTPSSSTTCTSRSPPPPCSARPTSLRSDLGPSS